MELWLDNTGLHTVGRCLEHKATSETDFVGVLQFCTQLALSEKLILNGFEMDQVFERSWQIHDEIIGAGLSDDALIINPTSEDDFREACEKAARSSISAIELIESVEGTNLNEVAPDLGSDILGSLQHFHEIVESGNDYAKAVDLGKGALKYKSGGATSYMISSCPELFESVQALRRKHRDWSLSHSSEVNILLRLNLLGDLSYQYKAIYAPAVGRARSLRKQAMTQYEIISDNVDKIVKEKCGVTNLPVPSIVKALSTKSKGEIHGLLKESIAAREKTKEVRRWISSLVEGCNSDSPEYAERLEEISNEIQDTIAKALKIKSAPRLSQALSVTFTMGIPSVEITGDKFMDWFNHRRSAKNLAVLTEFSKMAVYSSDNDAIIGALKKDCFKKS